MTFDNPLVSIIIPVYNRAALIRETIQSIQAQTYKNWEAIIIDDGSTDGSYEVVEKCCKSDHRIKLYKRQHEPKGAPTCRNIGIHKATGEYIIFLDSDDLMADNCIERRVFYFEKNLEEDFLVFQSVYFENEIHDQNIFWNIDREENDLERFLRTDALWPICGPIYKRKTITAIGGFREGLPFYQDFDLHLRLLFLKYKYRKFLEIEPDCFIRYHFNNSVSNSIPFTSDAKVLQQRIDFYFAQLNFINENNIQLNRTQTDTVWNVLYYFCSRFLLEHNNRKAYHKNWFKVRKLMSVNLYKHNIAYLVPVLTSLQKRSKYFIKAKSMYISYFKKFLADDSVIFNSTLKKKVKA
jgi:glycosyltransferase involved in cell wall biosynthesis